jgi:recombinational DNA repair protein (RecF pathway)
MRCAQCNRELAGEAEYSRGGRLLCEDCYMEAVSVPKTCDPLSVRSARLTREQQGHQAEEGLLPIQREIYRFIIEKQKVSRQEVAAQFSLSPKELEKHFAVLRHCELARGSKEGATVYLMPFAGQRL